MRAEIADFNRGKKDRELILKSASTAGAAIAVTLNDRLDYFGQTVNIAARVQGLAEADEIYLSPTSTRRLAWPPALEAFKTVSGVHKLKGVQQDLRLFCVPATH
jgi:class 3 adenylate cyclase